MRPLKGHVGGFNSPTISRSGSARTFEVVTNVMPLSCFSLREALRPFPYSRSQDDRSQFRVSEEIQLCKHLSNQPLATPAVIFSNLPASHLTTSLRRKVWR